MRRIDDDIAALADLLKVDRRHLDELGTAYWDYRNALLLDGFVTFPTPGWQESDDEC